jgi:hypothetical protein
MSPSQKDLFKLDWDRQYVNSLKFFMVYIKFLKVGIKILIDHNIFMEINV